MKSNLRKPDIQVLGKAEIEAIFHTDRCEVDILSTPKKNPCMEPKPINDFEELFEIAKEVNEQLADATKKIDTLRNLFKVQKIGGVLDSNYRIVFNESDESEPDDLGQQFFDKFVESYSLDINQIDRNLRMLRNLIEAKSLRGKPNYCEVDLFDKEKEPIEC